VVPPSQGKQRNRAGDDRDRIGWRTTDASLGERELENHYDSDGAGKIRHALAV
jgi:hypothetical protein